MSTKRYTVQWVSGGELIHQTFTGNDELMVLKEFILDEGKDFPINKPKSEGVNIIIIEKTDIEYERPRNRNDYRIVEKKVTPEFRKEAEELIGTRIEFLRLILKETYQNLADLM